MRIVSGLLLLGAVSCAFANQAENHFFVGASLGDSVAQNASHYLVDYIGNNAPYTDLLIEGKPSKDRFSGGVQFGYQWENENQYLLNVVAGVMLRAKTTYSISNLSYEIYGPNNLHHGAGISASLDSPEYSLSMQPGYALNEHSRVYVDLGVNVVKLRIASGQTYYTTRGAERDLLPASAQNKTLLMPQFGLGYAYLVSQHLSVNVNVNYAQANYDVQRVESGSTQIDRTETYSATLKLFNTEVGIRYLM